MRQSILLFFFICFAVSAWAQQVVTYTVTSKTDVLAEGMEPNGSIATFEQTGSGQKGQMTEGNSTTFTLTGMQGLRLEKVVLHMKSNSKAGAGSLQMQLGSDVWWEIEESSFADTQWHGAYSTAYVPIVWECASLCQSNSNMLSIQIVSSENSLYISSYTIYYSVESTKPNTVNFHTGSSAFVPDIAEESTGSGIILPDCEDADNVWHFVGWTLPSVKLTADKSTLPIIYQAGERYYPSNDCRLYALYADGTAQSTEWLQDTIFDTGYYLIADSVWGAMASGELNSKGKIEAKPLTFTMQNQDGLFVFPKGDYAAEDVYFIEFFPEDSTATILHVLTDTYIGYPTQEGTALKKTKTKWNYTITDIHQVAFYHDYPKRRREFRAISGMGVNTIDMFYWECSLQNTAAKGLANILFNVADYVEPREIHYTSFPFGTGVESTLWRNITITSRGVKNPQQIPLSLYSVEGILLRTSKSDLSFADLPCGVYVLCAASQATKIVVSR